MSQSGHMWSSKCTGLADSVYIQYNLSSYNPPEKTALANLRIPLLITICKLNQFNYPAGQALGYSRSDKFLSGIPDDQSKITWTGLHGNMSFRNTLNMLYNATHDVTFFSNLELTAGLNSSQRLLIPYGLCSVYEGLPHSFVRIHLDVSEASDHVVFVSDPASSASFQPSPMKGDHIELKTTSINGGAYTTHSIQLQVTRVEIDGVYRTAYPPSEFTRYTDCIEAEMREKIVPALGCMVPWISDQDACEGSRDRLPQHEQLCTGLLVVRGETCCTNLMSAVHPVLI